jgi:hypothetical protein
MRIAVNLPGSGRITGKPEIMPDRGTDVSRIAGNFRFTDNSGLSETFEVLGDRYGTRLGALRKLSEQQRPLSCGAQKQLSSQAASLVTWTAWFALQPFNAFILG